MTHAIPLLIALAIAALIGFAMQRGSTCAYLAVDEFVRHRHAARLLSLFETAFWVLAIAAIVGRFGARIDWPAAPALGLGTIAGSVLLGLGAWFNRGCTLGTLAKFGSGHWQYGWTAVGYFLACRIAATTGYGGHAVPMRGAGDALVAGGWLGVGVALVPLAAATILRARTHPVQTPTVAARAWPIHRATVVIGVAFAVLLLGVGPWSYTDLLGDLAKRMAVATGARLELVLALVAGLLAGGLSAGLWRRPIAPLRAHVRCLTGGLLLGAGGVTIPGGNDTLLLVGFPRLLPYAVAGVVVMLATLYACITLEARTRG